MHEYPVVIVGGGIGGLSTAAYLAQNNIASLVVESSDVVGGRCSTRKVMGGSVEIGALYVGGSVFQHLRNTFGVQCRSIPCRGAVRIGNRFVSFPIDLRHLRELWMSGVPLHALFQYIRGARRIGRPDVLSQCSSAGDALERISRDPRIRRFFSTLLSVSGLSPSELPRSLLSAQSEVATYRSFNPEMLIGGNSEIARHLTDVVKTNGRILTGQPVKRIVIEGNSAVGVATERETFRCGAVVSNAGIRPTVLDLTKPSDWDEAFLSRARLARESLMVVCVFLRLGPGINALPKGVTTFFMPYDVDREFRLLEQGKLPEMSMFILHIPSLLEHRDGAEHYGTLQFYYPRGGVDSTALQCQVDRVLQQGLSDLHPGLDRCVIDHEVYDPDSYRRAFGFYPHVFGVAPDLNTRRFPIQTPIRNLFCVGDSVGPEGPCVAQAMESGIDCGKQLTDLIRQGR